MSCNNVIASGFWLPASSFQLPAPFRYMRFTGLACGCGRGAEQKYKYKRRGNAKSKKQKEASTRDKRTRVSRNQRRRPTSDQTTTNETEGGTHILYRPVCAVCRFSVLPTRAAERYGKRCYWACSFPETFPETETETACRLVFFISAASRELHAENKKERICLSVLLALRFSLPSCSESEGSTKARNVPDA